MAEADIVLARAKSFCLGTLRISPGTCEIFAPGYSERLEPRVMQVLVALARADGEIVSRDDLIGSCWGGRIVGDDAVNRVIARIRRVAARAGGGDFQVETINKVGYRLLSKDRGELPSAGAPSVASNSGRTPGVDRRALLAGSIAAAAAAATGGVFWLARDGGTALSPDAEALVERGVAASRRGSAESTAEAVGFLKEAVRLEPDSARAWGALAIALYGSQHFLNEVQAAEARNRSRYAAERAIALDPADSAGPAALALALPTYGNWLEAERAMRRVLQLDDTQFETRLALSRLLANVGRTRAAVAMLEPLTRSAPLQPVPQYFLAFLLWQAGRRPESDLLLDRAAARWPRNYQIWFTRFWQRVHSGRPAEALAMSADEALRPIGIPEWNFELIERSARAVLTRASADVDRALEANLDAAPKGAGFAENAIEVAAQLGALGFAFEVADAYYFGRGFNIGPKRYSEQQGSYTRPARRETKLLFSPSTAEMRSDRRFSALAAETGLADYWRQAGSTADRMIAPLAGSLPGGLGRGRVPSART